jgi:hypothetical protein
LICTVKLSRNINFYASDNYVNCEISYISYIFKTSDEDNDNYIKTGKKIEKNNLTNINENVLEEYNNLENFRDIVANILNRIVISEILDIDNKFDLLKTIDSNINFNKKYSEFEKEHKEKKIYDFLNYIQKNKDSEKYHRIIELFLKNIKNIDNFNFDYKKDYHHKYDKKEHTNKFRKNINAEYSTDIILDVLENNKNYIIEIINEYLPNEKNDFIILIDYYLNQSKTNKYTIEKICLLICIKKLMLSMLLYEINLYLYILKITLHMLNDEELIKKYYNLRFKNENDDYKNTVAFTNIIKNKFRYNKDNTEFKLTCYSLKALCFSTIETNSYKSALTFVFKKPKNDKWNLYYTYDSKMDYKKINN